MFWLDYYEVQPNTAQYSNDQHTSITKLASILTRLSEGVMKSKGVTFLKMICYNASWTKIVPPMGDKNVDIEVLIVILDV